MCRLKFFFTHSRVNLTYYCHYLTCRYYVNAKIVCESFGIYTFNLIQIFQQCDPLFWKWIQFICGSIRIILCNSSPRIYGQRDAWDVGHWHITYFEEEQPTIRSRYHPLSTRERIKKSSIYTGDRLPGIIPSLEPLRYTPRGTRARTRVQCAYIVKNDGWWFPEPMTLYTGRTRTRWVWIAENSGRWFSDSMTAYPRQQKRIKKRFVIWAF